MTKPTKWQVCLADSDQPGHSSSLIRVFTVRMKKAWVQLLPIERTVKTDQSGWLPRLIRVFAGRTVILLVLSSGVSFYFASAQMINLKNNVDFTVLEPCLTIKNIVWSNLTHNAQEYGSGKHSKWQRPCDTHAAHAMTDLTGELTSWGAQVKLCTQDVAMPPSHKSHNAVWRVNNEVIPVGEKHGGTFLAYFCHKTWWELGWTRLSKMFFVSSVVA